MQHRRCMLALVLALVLLTAGCGGDEEPAPIPADDAAFLLTQLDELDRRVQARACNDVKRGNLVRIERRIDGLPENVDTEVRDALTDSVENLSELVNTKCRQKRRPPPEPEPAPEPVVPDIPAPTPSTTTPSTTTTTPEPTTTQEEQPPPKEDEGGDEKQSPPSGGGGGGGSNGGGKDNGGGDGGGSPSGGLPSGALTPPAGGGSAGGAGPTR
ncbi:MAG: hypothetical protein ACR2NV_01185 [Thermoleophilaceae bacterium]